MPFFLVEGDIAKMKVDVVVNAANERLQGGSGVCGAIFSGAGWQRMQEACDAIGRCDTGDAVATPGFGLPARHVVHAVGPVWRGGGHGEEELLRSAYRRALECVCELGARSVAFPLISAGVYGYPKEAALRVARSEIVAFLKTREDLEVTLAIYDRDSLADALADYDMVASLFGKAGSRGVEEDFAALSFCASPAPSREDGRQKRSRREESKAGRLRDASLQAAASPAGSAAPQADDELAWRLAHLDASFSAAVLSLIDERGLTDAQVYKRANLSRQVFSKLRRDDGYRPAKPTAVALAVALELTCDETDDLLRRAGYALGNTSQFDVIVRYYLEQGCHDVFVINEMLFAFDQPLLGSM